MRGTNQKQICKILIIAIQIKNNTFKRPICIGFWQFYGIASIQNKRNMQGVKQLKTILLV